MIFDLRIYDLRPGTVPEFMAAVREVALPVRRRHGVVLVGWYYTETGTLNRVYHTWGYRDWAHMEEAKVAFRTDPDFAQRYVPRVLPLIRSQSSQVVHAADFSPPPPDLP